MRLGRFGLVVILALTACGAWAQPIKDVYSKYEYRIPMRDGVKLYVSVYVPKDKPGKHPILLERTPYGAGPYGPETFKNGFRGSPKFREAGYIFAFADVRGRGQSEGVFNNFAPQLVNPMRPHDFDESTDSWDTIDFLVKNVPDNNGRVGTWGISYPGGYTALSAINSHPALKAASPQAPVTEWFIGDDFHHQGAFFIMDAVGFARFGQTKENSEQFVSPNINTGGDPYKFYLNNTVNDLTEKYFKNTDGLWHYLMEHGTYDEYWQARNTPSRLFNIHCAVMTVGGWFDAEDLYGAIHTYQGAEKLNPKIKNTLVMGPWFHGMWAGRPGKTFGDQDFGSETSTYYQEQIEFPFFDSHLRGDGKLNLAEAYVFQTGANRWRQFTAWPPTGTKPSALYLAEGKALSTTPPKSTGSGDADLYVSDPENPVPYQGGTIRSRTREYMIDDQRFATSRPDVLSYETPVLTSDTTMAGPVTADLHITTTGTDGDFVVKLIDVFPDDAPGKLAGYQMLVRAEIHRAKFRNSYQNPQPLTPGAVEHIKYDLPDVMHTFKKGHKIMVQVQSSWFPLVDRNPQKFMNIYKASSSDFQKATVRVLRTSTAPSSIKFGVLPEK